MSIRRAALDALTDITERGAYANLRLKEAQAGLSARDANFIAALVYETLDRMYYIDYVIAAYARGSLKPVIRGILRLGVCELLFLRTPLPVACDESVRLTKAVGKGALAGYVNGVLREIARHADAPVVLPKETKKRLSVQYSWPLWLVEKWIARFGEKDTEALLCYSAAGISLRAQPPYTAEELRTELVKREISFSDGVWESTCAHCKTGFDIANDPLFLAGRITVQSEAAMLVCRALGVKAGWRILDACAAPGGKTAYIAALHDKTALNAWELHPHRKDLLDKTLARLNVPAHTLLKNAAIYDETYKDCFDAVLLDVPCSGLGVAGGKPDIRYAKTPGDIVTLKAAQRTILDACAQYVKPGGVLLYASCTISREENEDQITAFLAGNAAYTPDSLTPYLPEGLREDTTGMLQLLPHVHRTDGFFIARMRKNA